MIDSPGTVSHLSIFSVDEDGNLTLLQTADTINSAANGVAVLRGEGMPGFTSLPPAPL